MSFHEIYIHGEFQMDILHWTAPQILSWFAMNIDFLAPNNARPSV